MESKKFNLSRDEAIVIFLRAVQQDDPYWENLVDEHYDEETDSMPSIEDVLRPLGITDDDVARLKQQAWMS